MNIADQLTRIFDGVQFGDGKKLDAEAWAALTKQHGYSVNWAKEWIAAGWPEPPAWMKRAYLPREEERNVKATYDSIEIKSATGETLKSEPIVINFTIEFGDTVVRSDEPSQPKYPTTCPCGIQAVDCKYHAGVKRG